MSKLKKQDADLLNAWVVEKLNELNWSMRKLGSLAGIHHSLISRVLSGKRKKDLGFYFLIAAATDSIPEMLREVKLMTDNEVAVLGIIKGLPTERQEEFFKFADFFAKNYQEKENSTL